MDHKALGGTDVVVPEIGLGAAMYRAGSGPLRAGISEGASLICQGRRENVPAGRSKTVPLNATL